jgi:transcriptional/translational regulatory protein YebC/TACO1
MPVDNIDRAVKKGAGGDAGEMEAVLYEAYGPGGCAMLIEELTDNKNRSVAEIKHTLSKHNLTLAGQGAALWAFMKNEEGFVPQVMITLSEADNESLTLLLKELDENDDVQDVWTNAEH